MVFMLGRGHPYVALSMSKRIVSLWVAVALGGGVAGTSIAFTPLGVPNPATIDYPNGKAPSEAEGNLGKALFFDRRLSSRENISCASCHNPDLVLGTTWYMGGGPLVVPLGAV